MTPHHEPELHVDLADAWRKSSFSTGSCTCVEVRRLGSTVQIRDSKAVLDPDSVPTSPPVIEVTLADWDRLCRRIDEGRPLLAAGSLSIHVRANGTAQFRCSRSGVELSYTAEETAAFVAGIRAGELRQRRLAA